MEVETFAAVAAVSKILVKHGFAVSTVASEKERNPHGTSEVSRAYPDSSVFVLSACAQYHLGHQL